MYLCNSSLWFLVIKPLGFSLQKQIANKFVNRYWAFFRRLLRSLGINLILFILLTRRSSGANDISDAGLIVFGSVRNQLFLTCWLIFFSGSVGASYRALDHKYYLFYKQRVPPERLVVLKSNENRSFLITMQGMKCPSTSLRVFASDLRTNNNSR